MPEFSFLTFETTNVSRCTKLCTKTYLIQPNMSRAHLHLVEISGIAGLEDFLHYTRTNSRWI